MSLIDSTFMDSTLATSIYPLTLQTVGLSVGLLLVAGHALALARTKDFQRWLRGFPRNRTAGIILLTIAALWTFGLVWVMDLGEFGHLQRPALILIPVGYVLILQLLDEFLAVRSLGILMVLAGTPLLEAAFLEPQTSRLLVTFLAYAWATVGMFWVGMPYLLRNQIQWITARPRAWQAGVWAGIIYGVLLVICALVFYGTA